MSEVLSLVEKLKSINITTIPFKGPTLSKVLYDNYSIRQAGDLDILIKPKDVIPTIDFLLDSGYHYSLQHLSKNQLSALINISPTNHIQLFHDRSNLCIELHWALAPMYLMGRKEVELLWDSLSTIYINSIRINNFSPENLFSILCLHGYKHSWYRLFWLWEISYFCQSKQDLDWDWDRILKISEVFGGKRIISTSFLVANTILEIQIPETIENYILKDPGAKRISGQILFESNLNQIRNPNAINTEALKSKFRTKVKLFNRIKHLIGFSFTPNYFDIKSIDLPPKFHFIYYLIRPFRFIYQRFQNN